MDVAMHTCMQRPLCAVCILHPQSSTELTTPTDPRVHTDAASTYMRQHRHASKIQMSAGMMMSRDIKVSRQVGTLVISVCHSVCARERVCTRTRV